MGVSESKAAAAPMTPSAAAAVEMQTAMKKCHTALQYLDTSAKVLTTKRNASRTLAVAAFKRGDKGEAVELLRKADISESDLQTIRRRQVAIERQKSMIEQQQLNTMLTSVLVETSAALHSANTSAAASSAGVHPAERIQAACEQMEEVADYQAEIIGSHMEFDDAARTAALAASVGTDVMDESDDASALARLLAMANESPVDALPAEKPTTDSKPKAPPPQLPAVPDTAVTATTSVQTKAVAAPII